MSELLPHLLRPWWLAIVPLLAWLLWRLWHRQLQVGRWQRLLPEAFHAALLTRGRLRHSRLPWLVLGLAWLLAVVLVMWVTESWHGIGPAWTGLAASIVVMLPRIGFITGDEFSAGVNMRTCIYVAGILGLAITVTQTGIGNAMGEALMQVMPLDSDAPFTSFLALTGITTALNFIMTANGVPALYTTLAQSFSDATGFPLLSVIMIQVLGYSTPLLPYQASPIVVAMGLGKVPARAGMLLCLALAVATYLVLLPLDYLWFSVLGKL